VGNALLKRAPAGLEPHVWTSHIQGPSCRTRRGRGVQGEGSNKDKECAEHRCRPRSPPARRESAAGDNKALSVATSWTDGLGVAAACRAGTRNRPRLWGFLLAHRRHDLATLRCNPWGHSLFIPCSSRFGSGCRDRGDTADDDIAISRTAALEKVAAMANHASTRTTQLYDRRRDEVSLDEVEWIVI